MTALEEIIRDELRKLQQEVAWNVGNPAEQLALAAMATDLALVPVRMARGEDVTAIVAALKAEGANRMLTHRIRVEAAAQRAWLNAIQRIVLGVLTGAIA